MTTDPDTLTVSRAALGGAHRIYVASSWRCDRQPEVVQRLREEGHEVYDFKHPSGEDSRGFYWSEAGVNAQGETAAAYLKGLRHPVAEAGFANDFAAMQWADTCVLVLPCGRSAHLELGWFTGQERRTAILLDGDPVTPELMYKLTDFVTGSLEELTLWLRRSLARLVAQQPATPDADPALGPDRVRWLIASHLHPRLEQRTSCGGVELCCLASMSPNELLHLRAAQPQPGADAVRADTGGQG